MNSQKHNHSASPDLGPPPSDLCHPTPPLAGQASGPAFGGASLRLGWWLVIAVLLLQMYSRYLPSPWAVFVADDWPNYARSTFYESHRDAILTGLEDPNRPISMAAVEAGYRIMGRNRLAWTALSLAANSLFLLFALLMAWELTHRRLVALATGVAMALLPNLVETYHWSTQILNEVTCALIFYALSGWMWVAFVRRGGLWRLGISAMAYLIALFSYEAGIFLPAAFVFLVPWRNRPLTHVVRLMPFAAICLLYVAWRVTDAFGMNQSWHYPPHMEAGLSLWGVGWNVRQMIHWWVGDHMFGSILSGLQSFATLAPWTRRMLVLGNIAVVGLIGWVLCRSWLEPYLEGRGGKRQGWS